MRLSFGQELQQKLQQKLILAPRMIQSMEILQLPIMALQERIEQELQENAVLEVAERDPDLPDEPLPAENPDAPTVEEREIVVDETSDNADDFERLLDMSEEWSYQFDERPPVSKSRLEDEADRLHDVMANMQQRPQTLHDYLIEQLRYFDLQPPLRQMAERIIYSLDDNGWLRVPLEDLLDANGGPEQLALARTALELVQRLDPPGVGARDLRECLLLQIKPEMPYHEEMHTLVADHLDELLHNRLPAIQRRTGYSLERIQAAIEQLRKLNPHPGADFSSQHASHVVPDVFVERDDSGRWVVRLEEGHTPRLYISPYYLKLLKNGQASPETREYIKRKVTAAQWLIDSIEQRRNTLRKVAQAIVDHQTAFLEHGPEHIEPLKMQQIADKVGVHVTTVSRAVDDKWIQTPRGIFPLKRFFVGGTVDASGHEVAWDAVRLKLQEIIDHEDKANPYSDDDLVEQLARHGIKVARRTVTKYRKAMNIPSSRQRRDWALLAQRQQSESAAPASNGERPASTHGTVPPSTAASATAASGSQGSGDSRSDA
jgi:RNA polymerase sigma-54 factor